MYDLQIEAEDERLTAAQATFEQERGRLYRAADGQPRYGEAEQKEQMAAITARLDAAIGAAQELAARITAEQQTQLQHVEHGDAFEYLSAVDEMNLNTRRAFIAEDAADLAPEDLVVRCQIALAGSDQANRYLWARYVGRRVAAAVTAAHAGDTTLMAADMRQQLTGLVEQLNTKVRGPEGVTKAEAARARLTRAQELKVKTIAVFDQAHGQRERVRAGLIASGRYNI